MFNENSFSSTMSFEQMRGAHREQIRRSIGREIEAELQLLRAYQNNHGPIVVTHDSSYAIRDIIGSFELLHDRVLGLPELADLRRVNCDLDDLKRAFMSALQYVYYRVVEQDNMGSFELTCE